MIQKEALGWGNAVMWVPHVRTSQRSERGENKHIPRTTKIQHGSRQSVSLKIRKWLLLPLKRTLYADFSDTLAGRVKAPSPLPIPCTLPASKWILIASKGDWTEWEIQDYPLLGPNPKVTHWSLGRSIFGKDISGGLRPVTMIRYIWPLIRVPRGREAVVGRQTVPNSSQLDHSLNVNILLRLDNQHEKFLLCSKSLRRCLGTESKTFGKTGFLVWNPKSGMQLNDYLWDHDSWCTSLKQLDVVLGSTLGRWPVCCWWERRDSQTPLWGYRTGSS